MIRLTEAIDAALQEAGVGDLLGITSKEDKKEKKTYFEDSDSGDAGAYDSPKAFRKKMKDVLEPEEVELDELVASMEDELDEMDAISFKKKSGSSLNPHPKPVGKSLDDEDLVIEDEEEEAMDDVERHDDEEELEAADTKVEGYKKRKVSEGKEPCGCGGKKKSVLKEALDYTEELYADDIAEMEDEADMEDYMIELYLNLMDLFDGDYETFVNNIDFVAPNPPTFRVELKNGQIFYMTITDRGAIATIEGKKYYLHNLDDEERAAVHLSRVLAQGKTTLEQE